MPRAVAVDVAAMVAALSAAVEAAAVTAAPYYIRREKSRDHVRDRAHHHQATAAGATISLHSPSQAPRGQTKQYRPHREGAAPPSFTRGRGGGMVYSPRWFARGQGPDIIWSRVGRPGRGSSSSVCHVYQVGYRERERKRQTGI